MAEDIQSRIDHLQEQETMRIRRESRPEIDWWGDRMIPNQERAVKSGLLVDVPQEGEGFRLIGPLRGNKEPRFLNPQALELLAYLGSEWNKKIGQAAGVDGGAFFSVTSLYRTPELQAKFVKEGVNAALVSAHQAGAAIDTDPLGYYLGPDRKSVTFRSPEFDTLFPDTLLEVIQKAENEGKCHLIIEKVYLNENRSVEEVPACYHVCVSPTFKR